MTIVQQILRGIDLLAVSLSVGATAWFFFIQSPVLYKAMKREQFVPLQMRLSKVLFSTLVVLLLVVAAAAATGPAPFFSVSTLAALLALVAGVVNRFVVFPRALLAGGRSMRLEEADDESSFVTDGAGKSATRMHRVVVLFVLVMVAGLVAHGIVAFI